MFGLSRLFHILPSRDRFAREIIRRLEKRSPGIRFEYDQELFRVSSQDSQVVFLDNAYLEYCRAAVSSRGKVMADFLDGLDSPEIPSDFAVARTNLLPVLRHTAGLESVCIESGNEEGPDVLTDFPMQPFSDELAIGVAYDSERAVQQIGKKILEKWQRSLDEIVAIALANLRDKAAPRFEQLSPGLYASQYGDYYDASRLLLPELAWQLPVRGTPVAMVPNRTCLLITGENDEQGITAMIAVSEKLLIEDSRPLGAEMFRLDSQNWKPWQPDGDAGIRLHNLQLRMLASDYEMQQRALNHRLKVAGEDVFVATYSVAQREGVARFHSFSVLTRGVDTFLPKTDLVYLADLETKESFWVPWHALESIAGYLLEPLSYRLSRYRVRCFPADAEMHWLREVQNAELEAIRTKAI